MQIKQCPNCGYPLRRVRPSLIIIKYQVIVPDDPVDPKVQTCTNPNCPNAQARS